MTDEYRSLSLDSSSRGMVSNAEAKQPFGEPHPQSIVVGHEADSDTLLLWKFNETEDTSGDLNYVQSVTATYSTRSLDFGGTDEYVNVGNVTELSFERTDAFSISLWFLTSITGSDTTFVSKVGDGTAYTGWTFGQKSTNVLVFYLTNTWSTNTIEVDTTGTYNDGEWHHVVMTYDGSSAASGVTIYIDGSSVATSTVYDTLSATTVTTNPFYLGARASSGLLQPFIGNMDEVLVFNTELSSSQVTTLYNSGVPSNPLGESFARSIVGYWRMGDGDTFSTITDHSSSGNNGTMTNMEEADITREVPAGYLLTPSVLSDWSYVPSVTYGPGGSRQPCRWFQGVQGANNFKRSGTPDLVSLLTGDHTIEVWIYLEDVSVGNCTVFEYSASGETEATNYLQRIVIQSDGKINIFWEYGAAVDVSFTTTSAYITADRTWYHLAVSNVVATGNRTTKIYIDGDYKEQHTSTNASGGTEDDLYIGVSNSLGDEFYGSMADMRLSSKERTSTEIAVSAATKDFKHLVDSDTFALWRMSEPPIAADEMGNYPLNPLSFTAGPGITEAIITDGGRARGLVSSGDMWGPTRDLIRSSLLSDEITVEFWFRFMDGCTVGNFTPSSSLVFFSFGGSGETEADNFLIQLYLTTDLKLANFSESGTGVDQTVTTTNPVLELENLWTPHHVAMTRSITNTKIQFYFDGQLVEEFTGLTNPSGATATDALLYVGQSVSEPFAIDDLRLSTKIRSAAEIASSYARGAPVGIVKRYRKRARDQGSEPNIVYVTWETNDPDGTYQGIIPGGGPLVDEVILDEFQV